MKTTLVCASIVKVRAKLREEKRKTKRKEKEKEKKRRKEEKEEAESGKRVTEKKSYRKYNLIVKLKSSKPVDNRFMKFEQLCYSLHDTYNFLYQF